TRRLPFDCIAEERTSHGACTHGERGWPHSAEPPFRTPVILGEGAHATRTSGHVKFWKPPLEVDRDHRSTVRKRECRDGTAAPEQSRARAEKICCSNYCCQ